MRSQETSQYELMTQTPIPKLVVKLAIPTVISMLVTNIYNLVDTAFVGRLGTSASGAVGIVYGFMMILQAIGFLFGQGSGTIMARCQGKRDVDKANRIASLGFCSALVTSVVVGIICFISLDDIVVLLGSTPTIAPYASTYCSFLLLSAPATVCSFQLNNLLRYDGKARLGMIGLLVGALLNIIGDPIFMFVLNMGIAGAGLSTCLSQIVSFVILLSFFVSGKTTVRISIRYVSFKLSEFWDIVFSGLPSLIRQGLGTASTIVLNIFSQPYGDAAIAAMSIVSRIVFFVFAIVLGIAQGFQPVSAFNYGAKRYKRVREAYKFCLILSEVFIVIAASLCMLVSDGLISIFRDDPDVIRIGTRALYLQCLTQVCTPFCTMTEMQLQSTGMRTLASITSSLKSGLIFIPVLFMLASARGLAGIQEAQPITTVLVVIPNLIFALWFFRRMPAEDDLSSTN